MPHRKPAGETSSLAVRNLKKRYGTRTVVQDVSLEVASGEVVGLLGPNGAGKTTCFYMIVGLVPPTAARSRSTARTCRGCRSTSARASGFRTCRRKRRSSASSPVGRTCARSSSCRTSTPTRSANAARRAARGPDDLAPARSPGAIAVGRRAAARGDRPRARTRPRFILLDEPFAGVDPIAVLEIQKIIGFLKERGIGVLITDHNVRETLGICDRAYIINEGAVLAAGAPGEIIYNESVRQGLSRRALPHVTARRARTAFYPRCGIRSQQFLRAAPEAARLFL